MVVVAVVVEVMVAVAVIVMMVVVCVLFHSALIARCAVFAPLYLMSLCNHLTLTFVAPHLCAHTFFSVHQHHTWFGCCKLFI